MHDGRSANGPLATRTPPQSHPLLDPVSPARPCYLTRKRLFALLCHSLREKHRPLYQLTVRVIV